MVCLQTQVNVENVYCIIGRIIVRIRIIVGDFQKLLARDMIGHLVDLEDQRRFLRSVVFYTHV